jgi:hypothetical protein
MVGKTRKSELPDPFSWFTVKNGASGIRDFIFLVTAPDRPLL